jgi:hypothetical protein
VIYKKIVTLQKFLLIKNQFIMKKLMVLIAATAFCVACNGTAATTEEENASPTEEIKATEDVVVSDEAAATEAVKPTTKKPSTTTPTDQTAPATEEKTIVEKVVDKVNTEVSEGATVIVDETQKVTTVKKKK